MCEVGAAFTYQRPLVILKVVPREIFTDVISTGTCLTGADASYFLLPQ